jgi:Trypsin
MAKRLLGVLAALVALPALGVGSASAITDGQLDGEAHPYVGLMVAYDASDKPLWACSGTLMSSTVFLTAGHCTYGLDPKKGDRVELWFEPGPIPLDHIFAGTGDAAGTPYTMPGFDPGAFYLHDLGVVTLEDPMQMDQYGALPGLDQLDVMKTKRGHQDQTFTTVGYGMQQSFPDAASWKNVAIPVRMDATPKLVQIDGGQAGDFGLVLSDNARTGGACYGDSGGPSFVGASNVVAAVTSGLANSTCAGTFLAFRLDRSASLGWLATFGVTPP